MNVSLTPELETVSRVIDSRPTTNLTRTTVARFDPEAEPILLSDLYGRHLAIDENEDPPVQLLLFTSGSLRALSSISCRRTWTLTDGVVCGSCCATKSRSA